MANSTTCGALAIDPSSLVNSQITAAGLKPANETKSTDASVCPRRFKTPPSLATNGNTCPGWFKSLGFALSATAAFTVVTLSAADTPVVTPFAASIVMVKAV